MSEREKRRKKEPTKASERVVKGTSNWRKLECMNLMAIDKIANLKMGRGADGISKHFSTKHPSTQFHIFGKYIEEYGVY